MRRSAPRVKKPRRKSTKRRSRSRKPMAADLKQSVLIAIKVPASPTSDTGPARKLLDAIGRRATPTKKRRKRR